MYIMRAYASWSIARMLFVIARSSTAVAEAVGNARTSRVFDGCATAPGDGAVGTAEAGPARAVGRSSGTPASSVRAKRARRIGLPTGVRAPVGWMLVRRRCRGATTKGEARAGRTRSFVSGTPPGQPPIGGSRALTLRA